MLLAVFVAGVLVGIVLIIILLIATKDTHPTGCGIVLGIIFTLFATFLAALPRMFRVLFNF